MKTNKQRRYPGESNKNRPDRAAQRREDAAERQKFSDDMTPQQRIERLDTMFGVGAGAKKERAKLQAKIANNQASKIMAMTAKIPRTAPPNNMQQLARDIHELDQAILPDEIMQEIAALNETQDGGGKKMRAKDRRKNKT